MIVETHDLWRTFGGVAAVAGIDFSLREGELRCLIGANGAGKSTFFKMLTGQIKPSAGRILIKGRDVTGWPSFRIARLRVGIKTQVPSLFDGLSVAENLRLSALRSLGGRHADAATRAVMDEIRMSHLADVDVGTLAHGQRQWVELGMVLVGDPDLVLLDEPAAGMTHAEVESTIALLNTMRGRRTMVIVEHDMNFIRRIAEVVTVFHRGRVLAEDTIDRILRHPEVRAVYLGQKAGLPK
jgi:branched-chain amino acid transport system ATP-binding protein